MKNTNKAYMIEGSKYQFSAVIFNAFVNRKKYSENEKGIKLTKSKITEELADTLHVSIDAVKNWLYGVNGPVDVEQVKAISEYFDIDYLVLLQKVEDENMSDGIKVSVSAEDMLPVGFEKKIGDYIETKRCIRNIYHKMLAYVLETDKCFNKYQNLKDEEITEQTYEEEAEDNERLKDLYNELDNELDRCYLDLPFRMHNDIRNYMWGVMFDYHDAVAIGKLEGLNYNPTEDEKKKVQETIEEMRNYFNYQFYKDVEDLFGDYMVYED